MSRALRALFVVAVLAALAPPASAGTYDVWSCAGPTGKPLPANGWVPQSYGGTIASTCGREMGRLSGALSPDQVSVGSFARWIFEAPPDTTIANVELQRTAGASGAGFNWNRSYFLFRDSPVLETGYGTDLCMVLAGPCARPGDPAQPYAEASRFTSGPLTSGRLIASAQCDGVQPCAAQSPQAAGWFDVYRARIGLADAFPPAFRTPPVGSLLTASDTASGARAVEFDASDRGGGLRAVEIVVDGNAVATTAIAAGGSCREPFSLPVPCPSTTKGAITLDTATVANGKRQVQVALVDAAGNRTLSDPVTVAIHNDKEPNGAPSSRDAKITAKFRTRSGRRRAERTIGFGRRVRIVGRLVDRAGTPIAGARLSVVTRADRLGAREREVARVVTGADGRYSWWSTPGPSRIVRIGYRAYLSDERFSASAEVMLGVRPAIALRVRPRRVRNGGRVRFHGRLLSGPARAGTQVVLEAVGRDVRQRVPVATLRADRKGRFGFRYRFLRSFAPFTYRFRARLIPQAAYPYAAGASPVAVVKIVR